MPGDEGSEPPDAASAATMPNASGKIDGTTGRPPAGSEDEVAMLQRPCEEHVRAGQASLLAVVAEPDDHGSGVHPPERFE